MKISSQDKVGEAVVKDYRAADVFKRHGIDFCCGGGISIQKACTRKDVNLELVMAQIADATKTANSQDGISFNDWPLDLMTDYIEKIHHRYIRNSIPVMLQYLNRVAEVHGHHHMELTEIRDLFHASAEDLMKHLAKEEQILFPYVREMASVKYDGGQIGEKCFSSIASPIAQMMHEHDNEGDRFKKIALLSSNYTPPEHACNTYRIAYAKLQEFENDLHRHIHLENNILFPKAIELEKLLNQEDQF